MLNVNKTIKFINSIQVRGDNATVWNKKVEPVKTVETHSF